MVEYYTVTLFDQASIVFNGQFSLNNGVMQSLTNYDTDASTNILANVGSVHAVDNAFPVTVNGVGFAITISYGGTEYNYLSWNTDHYQLNDVAQVAPLHVDASFVQVQNLFNTSYNFAGNASSYITVPSSDALTLGTNDFTIEWWQYQTDNNNWPRIFQVGVYGSAEIGVSIEGGNFYYWPLGQAVFVNHMNPGDYKNQWVHFVICRYTGVTKVFRNGTQMGSFPDTHNMVNIGASLTIGNESVPRPDGLSSFGGYIYGFIFQKNVALYKSDFTQLAIYNPTDAALMLFGNNSLGYWGSSASLNNVTTTYHVPNPLFMTLFPDGLFSAPLPPPPPLIPVSNTCFPAGTRICTDQVTTVAIQDLDKRTHTIHGKKIVALTRVVLERNARLIKVPRGLLGTDMPDRDTLVSENHGIFSRGHWIKARHLAGVCTVPYEEGQVLYNVLLEQPGKMVANHMIVETLDPNNGIARLYRDLRFDDLPSVTQRAVLTEINHRRRRRVHTHL